MATTAEGKAELFQALIKAQAKFETPKRTKTAKVQTRTGHNYEYKYSTLDELIAATRPALNAEGLGCFNNITMPGQNVVTVTAVLVHSSGQLHESEPLIFQVDGSPQSIGSAITYGKRYTMSALLGVSPEEDTDAQHTHTGNGQQQQRQPQQRGGRQPQAQAPQQTQAPSQPEPPEKPEDPAKAEEPITEAQVERLQRIVKGAGVTGREMKAWLQSLDIPDSHHIKRGQYQNIVLAVQGGKVPKLAKAAK